MKTIIALALCMVLAACGGSGSDAPVAQHDPQAAAPAPAPAASEPYITPTADVAIYADSIGLPEGKALEAIMGAGSVINRSIGGMYLRGAVDLGLMEEAVAAPVRVVVLGYMVNDARPDIWGTYTAEEYRAKLTEVAQRIKLSGKAVVLETAPRPVDGGPSSGVFAGDRVLPYAEAMREVGQAVGVVVCDRYAATLTATLADMPDGVHPAAHLVEADAALLAGCIAAALTGL